MSVLGASFIFEGGGAGGSSLPIYQLPSWDISTTYATGALTSYNGVIYRALGTTTGNQPDISPASWESYDVTALGYVNVTDPALNAATSTTNVDTYAGVIITLTGAGNAQTLQTPTDTATQKVFSVTNSSTSVSAIDVNGTSLVAGKTLSYLWDGSAWSIIGGTASTPTAIPTWGVGTTYSTNNLVEYSGYIYRAIAPTTGNTPNVSPAFWEKYNNTPLVATSTDPAINAAVSTAIVDGYDGVLITTTTTGNAQTIQAPTNANSKVFFVSNNDTSTDPIVVNGYTIAIGTGAQFYFDGTAWLKIEAPLHNDLAGRSIASAHPTSAIATDTTNFDGALSVTETTTQLALDRMDDYSYLGDWATTLAYRVGNLVRNGGKLYRANTAHTASATFDLDIANWDLVSEFQDWATGNVYKVGEYIIEGNKAYKCTTGHIAGATFAGDIANWTTVLDLSGLAVTAVKTTNYTASVNDLVFCDTSGGAFTITLPATPANGDKVNITDVANSFSFTNYLRIDSGANSINNGASPFDLVIAKSSITLLYDANNTNWVFIDSVPDVASTSTVKAKARGLVSTTASSALPVRWDTIEYDTHGAITTGASWKFTAPHDGYYSIKFSLTSTSATNYYVYKNGATKDFSNYIDSTTAGNLAVGLGELFLSAGDYVDIRPTSSVTMGSVADAIIAIHQII